MSETKKTPLWKQLAGALAGAAVAFVIYQGYTFVAPTVQGLVVSTDIYKSFTQPSPRRMISETITQYADVPVAPDERVRPEGTLGSPASDVPAAAPVVSGPFSSSASSQAALQPHTAWERRYQQTSSSSSVTIVPLVQEIASSSSSSVESMASSSSSAEVAVEPMIPAFDGAGPHPVWPTKTVDSPEPIVPRYAAPAPVAHGDKLPQSGFGAGLLAMTALGAVLGRKKFMKR